MAIILVKHFQSPTVPLAGSFTQLLGFLALTVLYPSLPKLYLFQQPGQIPLTVN